MFYRYLNIPSIIEMGEGLLDQVDELLSANHISFKNKILITQENLMSIYQKNICKTDYVEIVKVKGGDYEEFRKFKINVKDTLLVAFGGGSVIDFVKLLAKETDSPYITIPSTLSNDAIYSPIARLIVNGKKQSFAATAPLGIIIDTDIIRKSPLNLLLAGVGDLVSNFSAIQDCILAEKYNNEKTDAFAISLARMSANNILSFSKKDLQSSKFIEQLANGLIISGISMVLSKNSRPGSGAEHLISHAIDEYYPAKSTLHGIQVAWAQLLLEKLIRKNQDEALFLECFFEQIGMMDLIRSEIQFNEEDFMKILTYAKRIRNRFTVLNLIPDI